MKDFKLLERDTHAWKYRNSTNSISDVNFLIRHCTIYSVKRLSDGAILSIGDETTIGNIRKFELKNGIMYWWNEHTWYNLSQAIKNSSQPKQPTQQEVDREHYEIKEWDKGSLTIRRISDGQIFKPLDNVYWTYSDNKDKNFREDGVILEIVISKSENTNLQFHIKKENGEIVTKYLSNLNKVHTSQPTFTMDEIKSCCHDDSAGGGCLYLSMDKLLKLGKSTKNYG